MSEIDNTKAFERALLNDQTAVDDRHERGCVLRYGAVPDDENNEAYLRPETCVCHRRPKEQDTIYLPTGTYILGRTVSLPSSVYYRFKRACLNFLAAVKTP